MLQEGGGTVGGGGGLHGDHLKPPRRSVNDGQQEGVAVGDRGGPNQVEVDGGEHPSGNGDEVEGVFGCSW